MTTASHRAALHAALLAAAACSRPAAGAEDYAALRKQMVDGQIESRGISDARVLAAMRKVPREEFVPPDLRPLAYQDHPLPIGEGQTISQPYIVALMTELAAVRSGSRVLEVGTGSGYQAAVLAEAGAEVWSIEILDSLARSASERLRRLGYKSVHVRQGDGYRGWPEHAPFDAIVVTAAPPEIPPPLKEQLAIGGRLVIPVGARFGDLVLVTRSAKGFSSRSIAPVAFVPMTGEALQAPAEKRP
jgi:protein-L-isoaspartate(D-aspartate) O-methyltransferase